MVRSRPVGREEEPLTTTAALARPDVKRSRKVHQFPQSKSAPPEGIRLEAPTARAHDVSGLDFQLTRLAGDLPFCFQAARSEAIVVQRKSPSSDLNRLSQLSRPT